MRVDYDASRVIPDALRPYLVGEQPRPDGEWDMFCPLHDDNNRSAQLNIDKGVWFCHAGCGGGSVRQLLSRQDEWLPPQTSTVPGNRLHRGRSNLREQPLSDQDVQRYAQALLSDEARVEAFQEARGIWRKTMVDFELGWDEAARAYTIPVRDRRGELQNIRRYQPYPPPGRRKMWSVNGHGAPKLYPISSLSSDTVIICEGELDALITIQHGFPAITRTASAITWKPEWSALFENKLVYVCHDLDKAGDQANGKVMSALEGMAREVRVIRLPGRRTEKHGKDLTDWWMEHDGDTEAFIKMMKGAKHGRIVRLPGSPNGAATARKEGSKLDPFDLTDDGNARRFIEQHRGKLVYATGPGWMRWSKPHYTDGTRNRRVWKPVAREAILKDVKRTVRAIREEAMETKDIDDQILLLKWAKRSLNTSGLKACRDSVEGGDPHIADLVVSVEELDRNPDILNVRNGIIDLRNGKVRKANPNEYCTMLADAAYNPEADQSEWQRFLRTVMPDADLRDTLQLCMGASITARPTRSIFVLFGPEGENGKTQLVQAVAYTLGTYAATAHESTFTSATARDAGYDLADFRGKRFMSFAETREGHGLASERIKRITGDETVRARHPYGRFFEYRPVFSLWLTTNHAPYIPASDPAMWKRVTVWPMNQVIPRNKQISDYGWKLAKEHGEAILAWLVEGAMRFYKQDCRLGPQPKYMEELRAQWKARDDIVGRWLEDRTVEAINNRVRLADLWQDFDIWCDQQGEHDTFKAYTAQKFHREIDMRFQKYPRGTKTNGSETRMNLAFKTGGSI